MDRFQNELLEQLKLQKEPYGYGLLHQNPEHPDYGFVYTQERPNEYVLIYGDYTIARDFSLSYSSDQTLLHFGIFQKGTTSTQKANQTPVLSQPSSFFTIEENLCGFQNWVMGTHYQGLELLIYQDYLTRISIHFPGLDSLPDFFEKNQPYAFLPDAVELKLEELMKLYKNEQLTPLMLESKILECLALFLLEVEKKEQSGFLQHPYVKRLSIGQNRSVHVTRSDLKAVANAHEIIRINALNPPSIEQLADMVGLSTQKLRLVFQDQYHTGIGAYITSVRMTTAARLLTTTQLPIVTIASMVGYQQSTNFTRMFTKTYGRTPAAFRKDTAAR